MNIIAAADRNWGIGINGELLISIPDDMKFFRKMTTGNVVVMGRKTLESFPGGRPLKNRVNIVLTSDKDYNVPEAVVVHSVEELLETIKEYETDKVFVIGGGTVYRQLMPYCDTAYITFIDYQYQADTFLDNLDKEDVWKLEYESDEHTYFDVEYYFRTYKRADKKDAH